MPIRSAPMTIDQAANTYNPAVQKYWLKTQSADKELYKEYFNVVTGITDLVIKEQGLTGFAQADFDGGENSVMTADVPIETYQQTYTQERIRAFTSFTHKMWKFGITKRNLTAVVNDLRKSIIRKREALCAARVNNAFLTSYTDSGVNGSRTITITGGDGVAAASAAHTRPDGGSNWSNIVTDSAGTVNLPFDYAGLKAAHRTAANIPDDRGNPMEINLDTLVCAKGSNVYFKAQEILKAIQKNEIPGSMNHDGAAVAAFKIVALPPQYMTNTEYWAMFDSSMKDDMHGFQYLESSPVSLSEPNIVFKTDEIQYKADLYLALGHNDIRGWLFSKGTSAA